MNRCNGGSSSAAIAILAGFTLSASADPLFPPTFPLDTVDGVIGFRVDGISILDRCGSAVASAGDLNHDGIGDFIVGADRAGASESERTGRGYVIFGRAATSGSFPAVFDLTSLNGANGFVLDGFNPDDRNGSAAAPAGDFNGDGVDDLIIGAPGANPSGITDAGQAYVVFGRDTTSGTAFPALIELGSLDGVTGVRLDGSNGSDGTAASVRGAGDVNGDGVDDVIIGAPSASPGGRTRAGKTYVVFGRDTTAGATFPPGILLSTLTGLTGFRLDGVAAGDASGVAVTTAGDFNHDGVDDIVIGANTAKPGGRFLAGAAYVVFGRDTTTGPAFPAVIALSSLNGTNGFRMDGLDFGDVTGSAVASGDINGDGISDVLVGAPQGGGPIGIGRVYVVFGRDTTMGPGFGASFDLATLNGANGFRADGAPIAGWAAISLASGDINGDGIGDVIAGAPTADVEVGTSYILFGRDTATGPGFPAAVSLSDVDGMNGFKVTGREPRDQSGWPVGTAGDINADGVDDLIVGAPAADREGRSDAGEVYIVYGRRAPCIADLTGDDIIDFGDYLEFLNLFAAGDPRVDFTLDGIVDFSDYLEFLTLFDTGC